MKHLLIACLMSAFSGIRASAEWVQWSPASGGNGHFYMAVQIPNGIDWYTAESQAVSLGGHLATITSAAENDFVFSMIATDTRFWVTVGSGTRGPWLGGYQIPGSQEPAAGWAWVTGEPFSYQNWA